ncbi:MAG: RNA polymerase subunit sigma-70, partial [Fervidobacterium sp.]
MIKYVLRSKPTEKLVELAQSGLNEAVDLLIEKYYPMVVRIAS